ncbi:hypothetical protein BJV82DRAFT_594734 [Fennellomyces sp. T-0311]|nr:hypothetical protein BJV82DRAFT_594734 [Fennellomyces sp. T-0311]
MEPKPVEKEKSAEKVKSGEKTKPVEKKKPATKLPSPKQPSSPKEKAVKHPSPKSSEHLLKEAPKQHVAKKTGSKVTPVKKPAEVKKQKPVVEQPGRSRVPRVATLGHTKKQEPAVEAPKPKKKVAGPRRSSMLARLTAPTASSARKNVTTHDEPPATSVKRESRTATIAIKTARSRIVKSSHGESHATHPKDVDGLEVSHHHDKAAAPPPPQPQGPGHNSNKNKPTAAAAQQQ